MAFKKLFTGLKTLHLWDNEAAHMKAPGTVLHLSARCISIMCTSHLNVAYAAGKFFSCTIVASKA